MPEKEIFLRARRQLHILGGAIFFALSLVLGSIYVRDSLRKNLATNEGVLAARQTTLAVKQADLVSIKSHIARYRELKNQGLIGTAERESWVEQLVASRAQLGVGDALSYLLKPPTPVAEPATTDGAVAAPGVTAAPGEGEGAVFHDLEFEIRGTYETELFRLFADYRSKAKGRFRMQFCRLGSPSSNGLNAQCTIRFFNLPEAAKSQ